MTTIQDWEHWQGSWRGGAERMNDAGVRALIEKTARARAAIVATQVLSTVVAGIALLVVAAALQHAANALELTLGVIVAIGVVSAWVFDASNRLHALDKVESAPEEYAVVRRALSVRRVRFAYFAWLIVALDFAFLVPWWIGGVKVHGFGFDLMHLLSTWGPMAMMIGFVAWTVRLRRQELRVFRKAAIISDHD